MHQNSKDKDSLANERMRGVHDTLLAECLHGPAHSVLLFSL